jgi:hypothetical protein
LLMAQTKQWVSSPVLYDADQKHQNQPQYRKLLTFLSAGVLIRIKNLRITKIKVTTFIDRYNFKFLLN